MNYKTKGVCSSEIQFDVEDDIVKNVKILGGCAGNTVGVCRLVEGMHIDDVIALFDKNNNILLTKWEIGV